jgi:hypothetical protein
VLWPSKKTSRTTLKARAFPTPNEGRTLDRAIPAVGVDLRKLNGAIRIAWLG